MDDLINWCEVLVGIPQEMRLLERRRRRWDDNIKIVNKELGSSWDKCVPVCGPIVGFVDVVMDFGVFQRRWSFEVAERMCR